MDHVVFDYLNPKIPAGLRIVDVPLVRATSDSIDGYGEIARTKDHRIEIVPWPLKGHRKLDAGTGIEGGTTEGVFACEWRNNQLLGRNGPSAATMSSVFASGGAGGSRCRWRATACCCGMATTIRRRSALLADEGKPSSCRRQAGRRPESRGLHRPVVGRQLRHLHPSGIWHEGVFPVTASGRFFDKQAKVHARVSCDRQQLGVLLNVPLPGAI
jgi:hypothetical protein